MLYLKFLFSLILIHMVFIHAGFISEKLFNGLQGHLDRFDAQCRGKNVTTQSFFQGIKTESAKILIYNFTHIVKEDNTKKLWVTITINRCRFKENLDSCMEYFKKQNIEYCKTVDPDNVISRNSPFFIPFEPPLKCPVKKGVYQAYNVTIDLSPFLFFRLDGWYWKGNFEVYDDNNILVYCIRFEGYFTNTKSKKM